MPAIWCPFSPTGLVAERREGEELDSEDGEGEEVETRRRWREGDT